jgi:hypothetical protein
LSIRNKEEIGIRYENWKKKALAGKARAWGMFREILQPEAGFWMTR